MLAVMMVPISVHAFNFTSFSDLLWITTSTSGFFRFQFRSMSQNEHRHTFRWQFHKHMNMLAMSCDCSKSFYYYGMWGRIVTSSLVTTLPLTQSRSNSQSPTDVAFEIMVLTYTTFQDCDKDCNSSSDMQWVTWSVTWLPTCIGTLWWYQVVVELTSMRTSLSKEWIPGMCILTSTYPK